MGKSWPGKHLARRRGEKKDVVGMRKLVARIEARVRVLQKGICICSQILIEALERLYSFLL